MDTVFVKQIFEKPDLYMDKVVSLSGWIRTIRDSKKFGFIELNDGTFLKNLQIVIDESLDNFGDVVKLTISSAITVKGVLVESPGAKQPFEIQARKIIIEGAAAPDYPLQKKRHTFEYLRTIAHLRPRTNTFSAVFRIRSLAHLQPINSFKNGALSTFTRPSLPLVIVKVLGNVSGNYLRLC